MVGCGILQKVTRLCLVLGVLISTSSCKFFDRDANYISKDKVWKKIRSEAPKLGLEPSFVSREIFQAFVTGDRSLVLDGRGDTTSVLRNSIIF